MSDRTTAFLNSILEAHGDSTRQTIEVLGEQESFVFVDLYNDALDVTFAALDEHRAEFEHSVVALALPAIKNALMGMQFDFLMARYAEVGRTLRFVWELTFHGYLADTESQAADGSATTMKEKMRWLGQQGHLTWRTGVRAVL